MFNKKLKAEIERLSKLVESEKREDNRKLGTICGLTEENKKLKQENQGLKNAKGAHENMYPYQKLQEERKHWDEQWKKCHEAKIPEYEIKIRGLEEEIRGLKGELDIATIELGLLYTKKMKN
jgi:hypothetical protein